MRKVYLDFTGIYAEEASPEDEYLDLQDIRGTDMYCTPEAQMQIRERIAPFGAEGIHFLDSGNYHYASALFGQEITEDFTLVLFDHHTDMQKPLMEDLLSCGGWAAVLADSCKCLKQILVVGPPAESMQEIEVNCREKLLLVSEEEVLDGKWQERLGGMKRDLPVYVSIDRDVLDPAYAKTNWDQGKIKADHLEGILSELLCGRRLIGADFCGELSDSSMSIFERQEARALNRKTDERLLGVLGIE